MASKVRDSLSQLSAALQVVDGATEALELGHHKRSELSQSLSSLEDAKLSVCLAYSAASLFYVLQNVSGGGGDGVQDELAVIKSYVSKIKQIEIELEKSANDGKGASISIDKESDKRETASKKRPSLAVAPAPHQKKEKEGQTSTSQKIHGETNKNNSSNSNNKKKRTV